MEDQGKKTLDLFCHWVEENLRAKETEFDVAVLLTRTNIGPAGKKTVNYKNIDKVNEFVLMVVTVL